MSLHGSRLSIVHIPSVQASDLDLGIRFTCVTTCDALWTKKIQNFMKKITSSCNNSSGHLHFKIQFHSTFRTEDLMYP